MSFEYEALLKRGRENLPEKVEVDTRFEVPRARGHIQGNKTIISNFHAIAGALGRPSEHLLKVVLRELATPGELKKAAMIVGAKIPASRINEKIQQYVRDYVLCPECGKPDTKLSREERILFIRCSACGAKRVVKAG